MGFVLACLCYLNTRLVGQVTHPGMQIMALQISLNTSEQLAIILVIDLCITVMNVQTVLHEAVIVDLKVIIVGITDG